MQMFPQKIEIKDIILLTETNEITLTGRISRNTLQYDTQISIDTTQLNLIINQLQKNNPEIELLDLLIVRSAENFNFYELNLTDLRDKSVDTEILNYQEKVIKQIRA